MGSCCSHKLTHDPMMFPGMWSVTVQHGRNTQKALPLVHHMAQQDCAPAACCSPTAPQLAGHVRARHCLQFRSEALQFSSFLSYVHSYLSFCTAVAKDLT